MNLEIWCRIYLDRRTPEDVAAELRARSAPKPKTVRRAGGVKILYVCHRFPVPAASAAARSGRST